MHGACDCFIQVLSVPVPMTGPAVELCVDRSATASASRAVSTVTLMRRMLVGVLVSLAAFGVAGRLALDIGGLDALPGTAIATVVGLLAAVAVMPRTVKPLVAVQADLQVRYEAAVADALRDQLTGLGNHRAFHEDLDRLVATAMAEGAPIALLLIDLDEFKQLNDSHGHAAGDRALRGFGRLLSIGLRRSDRAYRVGGDEFAVIMPATDFESARMMGRRLLAQALQPAMQHEDLQSLSFSGGVAAIPDPAADRARLYSMADGALYAAKRGGRTDVIGYDASIEVVNETDVHGSAAAIADVIARGQLNAVYQPIVALASGRILGVEGLIRPVPPAPFEDVGAMLAVAAAGGRLTALEMACADRILAGARHLPADMFLTLNLSPATIEAPEFGSSAMLGLLGRHDFPPERLVIEMTEHHALHDPARARERLEACRRAGIRFAADDVGAGNAGLRLLSELTFDIIKVDLDLVQRSALEGPSAAVIGSVVELANRMGALVVAEGIEHASQLPSLHAFGVQAGQGHHLGRPGPIEDVVPEVQVEAVGISAWRQSIGLSSVN